jgi:hypothetical protein
MTQNNLGLTLFRQGELTSGQTSLDLLNASATAFRASLEVRTRTGAPADWATTQNNLGLTFRVMGWRTGGSAGVTLLDMSISAFRSSLEISTREIAPADWAKTQENLALAYGTRFELSHKRTDLVEARLAAQAALSVYDLGGMEAYAEKCRALLAVILSIERRIQ